MTHLRFTASDDMRAAILSYKMIFVRLWTISWLLLVVVAVPQQALASEPAKGPSKAFPDVLVYADSDMGQGAHPSYVIIVDKARQQIRLYNGQDQWRTIGKWPCSTGKQTGPKAREGDQKTPVGVYFAVREVDRRFLSDTYGNRALPLDYPNDLDRRSARSGSAIWLHGTNRPLQPRDSNGCVVLENHVIDQLARYIQLNRTPVIIVERAHLWLGKKALRLADRILTAANQWHDGMMYGSYRDFTRQYVEGARPSMKWWRRWCRYRRKKVMDDAFVSQMRRRAIYRSGRHFVLLFDHHLKRGAYDEWAGYRKLYFIVEEDRVSIVAGGFQFAPKTGDDPLFCAWRKLWQKSEQRSRIAVTQNGDKNS